MGRQNPNPNIGRTKPQPGRQNPNPNPKWDAKIPTPTPNGTPNPNPKWDAKTPTPKIWDNSNHQPQMGQPKTPKRPICLGLKTMSGQEKVRRKKSQIWDDETRKEPETSRIIMRNRVRQG